MGPEVRVNQNQSESSGRRAQQAPTRGSATVRSRLPYGHRADTRHKFSSWPNSSLAAVDRSPILRRRFVWTHRGTWYLTGRGRARSRDRYWGQP
ncbi:hypothetical protein N7510_008040 [Penicillium lagena]|uniref:uncharacterized protein n=1 Tax=Penicillium lagena TaxID=94218 RepID=UPI002541C51B|nr:uncharacterized protein N7510_008040 [Penicillium lagena]KAJ5611321.1 hypothetical protein N7510_008040 [Penicillium lagena]